MGAAEDVGMVARVPDTAKADNGVSTATGSNQQRKKRRDKVSDRASLTLSLRTLLLSTRTTAAEPAKLCPTASSSPAALLVFSAWLLMHAPQHYPRKPAYLRPYK